MIITEPGQPADHENVWSRWGCRFPTPLSTGPETYASIVAVSIAQIIQCAMLSLIFVATETGPQIFVIENTSGKHTIPVR